MRKQERFPAIALRTSHTSLHGICTNANPHCLYYVNRRRHEHHPSISICELVETLPGVYVRTLWDSTSDKDSEDMNGIAFYLNARNTFLMTREPLIHKRLAPYCKDDSGNPRLSVDRYPEETDEVYDATGTRIRVTTFGKNGRFDYSNIVAVRFEVVGGEEVAK
jgi:hypothetical protein